VEIVRSAFDALPGATGIVADGRWIYANPALRSLVGRDPTGEAAIDVIAPHERGAVGHHYAGREGVHSTRWMRPDGGEVAVEISMRALAVDGKPAFVVAVTDHSTRELLITNLGASKASLLALVDTSPDAMFVHGAGEHDYDLLWMNRAMLAVLGYVHSSDLIGKDFLATFVHPDDRELIKRYRRERQTGVTPGPVHLRWIRRDGAIRDIEGISRPLIFADAPAVLVSARDITEQLSRERERVVAEAALRESEARYRMLFDGSPVPISLFDASTLEFVAVNQKMTDVYGYSHEEFLAMSVEDVRAAGDTSMMRRDIAGAPVGRPIHAGVKQQRRKDGKLIDVDITAHKVVLDGRPCMLAIGVDVTEARRIEEQLRHSQKMEAIGQLAGGVAHDFNNVLAIILATTSFLQEELGDRHPNSGDIADIQSAAERAADLTRQLLAFSRKQPRTPKLLSIGTIVEDLEKMLRRIVGEDVVVETRTSAAGSVHADPGQIEQVIMNLVVNARDAMPNGGHLTIETSNAELDETAATYVGVTAGAYTALTVTDTGCGIDAETRNRIFEPFFTTKAVGRGTGLGLATVFGIVKQAGGGVSVYSEVGRGSTFRVYLPRADHDVVDEPKPTLLPASSGSEAILVVEDDAQLRALLQRRLRSLGYRTIEARDATSAVDAIEHAAEPVHLLLTDLVMPGVDGRALASQLLRERPELKVVFMSGYSEHAAIKTAALRPNDHFIQKPFTINDLATVLRRALESTPGSETNQHA
jgi:two-component system, cell cycle sensor histidine kinase and response regulator CckA